MRDNITPIIKRAYDLHVHIGPEIIPRKYTVVTLIQKEQGNVAGMVLKNHFFATTPFMNDNKKSRLQLFGSVVLNNFVGGLNADAVYATSTLSKTRFIVWFPTVSAKKFLTESAWEIAPEWVNNSSFRSRKATSVTPITIFNAKGTISNETIAVLKAIKETDAILATGHISWQESYALIRKANKMGIRNMIITHPIYQRIATPIAMQKKLASMGAKIEFCWSMWKIDKISISNIAAEIKAVGAKNCILSSDSGQAYSKAPSVALKEFCETLLNEGITRDALIMMLITNPKKILGIRREVKNI